MRIKVLALIAALVVLFALGFRGGHPQNGLESVMGSAQSSVVIYKHSDSYEVGDKVVVVVAGQGLQTGLVKAATPESVDVDTKASFVRVKQEDVSGKLMLVIPFFGLLFNVVGL
jgi:hypothetical protein